MRNNRSDRPIPTEIVGCTWRSLAFAWMDLKEQAEDMEAALIEIRDYHHHDQDVWLHRIDEIATTTLKQVAEQRQ